MSTINIIVAYHKQNTPIVQNPIYIPVYTKQNTGDNISQYEPYLNELCALYWYWKNTTNLPDFIGMQLYRRYFIFDYTKTYNVNSVLLPKEPELLLLNNIDYTVDIHLPTPLKVSSIYNQYMMDPRHNKQDFTYCEQMIEGSKEYFTTSELYYSNMFILRKDLFLEYCEWLFNIINKLLELHNFKPSSRCYISERLTSFWLYNHKNKYKSVTLPTVTINKSYFR